MVFTGRALYFVFYSFDSHLGSFIQASVSEQAAD